MEKKRVVVLILVFAAILLKAGVIYFTFQNYGSNVYTCHYAKDFDCWFDMFGKISDGRIPLVDFPKEYPAGAVLLNWGLSFLHHSGRQFILVYGIFMLIMDLLVAAVLWRILKFEKRRNACTIILLYLFLPTMLILNHVRFDIVPVFFAILAYYCWRKGQSILPSILLGIGASIKWFPGFVVIAIFLNEVFIERRLRKAFWQAFISLAVFICMDVPFLILNFLKGNGLSNWLWSYTENYSYRINIDTVPGIIRILSDVRFSSGFLLGITFAFFLITVFSRSKKNVPSNFVLYCFSFLLFNKIYSPQFHIWFLPFLLLCLPGAGEWRLWKKGPQAGIPVIIVLELANVLVYPFSFTWFLQDVGCFRYAEVLSVQIFCASVFLRALLLIWIGWGVWRR